MWNISKPNATGAHTRQYSTMPPLLQKTLPPSVNFLSGLCTSFDYMHKISTQKRFVNPNFVNDHSRKATANTLVEKCSIFLENNKPEETEGEPKETGKRMKMTRAKNPKKKGGNKGKTKHMINLKYEVDEVGLDALSDSYDSDLCSSPVASPMSGMDHEAMPCFECGDVRMSIPESKPKSAVVISINTPPKISGCRSRIPSDCGSEDSFVVFQCSPDDVSDGFESEEEMDTETDSNEDDDDSDDSSCSESNFGFKTDDEVDFSPPATRKKVRFADDLFVVHPMYCWSYAYQEARKGPWEKYVADRDRFKKRVKELEEEVLGPVLQPAHRRKIFEERFARTED